MKENNSSVEGILARFQDFQHVFLATMDDDQPRVRPVTLIKFDGGFWVMTGRSSGKVYQILENPKVEFSFVFQQEETDCCLRITGKAEIIEDKKVKEKLANHCTFFAKHWKSVEDPDYTLLKISPTEAKHVTPEETEQIEF